MKLQELTGARRALVIGLVLLFLMVVLFALAEGAVRVRQYLRHGFVKNVEETTTIDEASGLRVPAPGATYRKVRINSLGFRGPEITQPKPEGVVRIAFLGGSTTFCGEVSSNEHTWPHLVWQSLSDTYPDARFDYVNAGVVGYGVAASLRNLEHRVAPLDPDVIVVYHATNDLSANTFEMARERGLASERAARAMTWPSKYSVLWYLVEFNLRVLVGQERGHQIADKLPVEVARQEEPFRSELESLVTASANHAALVVLPTFSIRLRRDQTPEQQKQSAVTSLFYMPYMSIAGLLDAFDAYNGVIEDVAYRTGALLAPDANAIPGDAVHFRDSVHFTDAGSQAMAARVSAALVGSPRFAAIVERRAAP